MATSYPDRTNARGIWSLSEITKNIKTEGTWPRGSTRGIFYIGTSRVVTVEYITIETTGDSTDFGDLTVGRDQVSSVGSFTRSIFSGVENLGEGHNFLVSIL